MDGEDEDEERRTRRLKTKKTTREDAVIISFFFSFLLQVLSRVYYTKISLNSVEIDSIGFNNTDVRMIILEQSVVYYTCFSVFCVFC